MKHKAKPGSARSPKTACTAPAKSQEAPCLHSPFVGLNGHWPEALHRAAIRRLSAVQPCEVANGSFPFCRMRTPCPKPSLLNYESGHSRLATGFEKQPVKFEFRFFILAGSYAAFAAIDAEKSYFSIRPTPATRRFRKADIQMTAVP